MASVSLVIVLAMFCLGALVLLALLGAIVWLRNRDTGEAVQSPLNFSPPASSPPPVSFPPTASFPPSAPDAPISSDLESQVQALMQSGNKIEAIKVYRQATGVGLKEAKDAVEAVEGGQALFAPTSAPLVMPGDLQGQVQALLQSDNKIEAIKVYREATGAGLQEAKDAVEAFESGAPLSIGVTNQPVQSLSGDLHDQIIELLRRGNKIEAIKVYRQATGMGLKDAKDAVEAIESEL